MEDAGQRLKRRREELNLRYRDVEEASGQIAARKSNDEFSIALSRLADIENKGTVPSIYRLYSLCAIYRLDLIEVLEWYGIDLSLLPGDAATIEVARTHLIGFHTNGHGEVQLPLTLDPGIDLRKTTYLSRMIQRWGKLPLMLLNGFDLKAHRYAYVGSEDWSMFPLIHPGSLLLIDETRKRVANGGWSSELDRPVYFLEHRDGYVIGWCSQRDTQMIVQPHPASELTPEVYAYPREIEVVGQVLGVAMRLQDPAKRRRARA
jgi:transcriptional regulator with XRE-family HTH domain